jgi:hypothetical protein
VKIGINFNKYLLYKCFPMKTKKQSTQETVKEYIPIKTKLTQFPIVGIGASAGGLVALEQFFSNMPVDNGMAFIIIQHLDPSHPDIMPYRTLNDRIDGLVITFNDITKYKKLELELKEANDAFRKSKKE